ncbi:MULTISPECIES: hypothetical protein [Herbaspirillum]|uniref:Uncharacterized protein n=2 Tax=Herbaspirillum huttiense TaxID=863372 RepID=A0AAJ2H9E0_9BURK|nr:MULTISPECIES: hypothetical protein [Herbaspirillum]MDR9836924.1 hypothetical protein [Herbaspirillum huttiense]
MSSDIEVFEELVIGMPWMQAVKTIRELDGGSSKEAGYTARKIVTRCPESVLAKSYFSLPEDSASRQLFG